jgi:hypothetical protein
VTLTAIALHFKRAGLEQAAKTLESTPGFSPAQERMYATIAAAIRALGDE